MKGGSGGSDRPTVYFAHKSPTDVFLISLKHNSKIRGNPHLMFRLGIINSIKNNDLTPILTIIENYCYKIPKNSIKFAKKLKQQKIVDLLQQIQWLNYQGGY